MIIKTENLGQERLRSSFGHIGAIDRESLVDGPGIRYVLFFKGCGLGCTFCHNPDLWEMGGTFGLTVDEIWNDFTKNNPKYKNIGLTVSGGEPLLQLDFLINLFKKFHEEGINICLEASGYVYTEDNREKYIELLKLTDLVYLDIKATYEERYTKITKGHLKPTMDFLRLCNDVGVKTELHYVILSLEDDVIRDLKNLKGLKEKYKNVIGIKLLPYQKRGVWKYKELGLDYELAELDDVGLGVVLKAEKIIKEQ